MSFVSGTVRLSAAVLLVGCLTLSRDTHPRLASDGDAPLDKDTVLAETNTPRAHALTPHQLGVFEPNLGQWDHAAKFLHRSGPTTMFLENRGWVINLVEQPARPAADVEKPHSIDRQQQTRAVALRMTFEGDRHVSEIVGERRLPGHHNYFLGNDESRWRAEVPLYASVRYEKLYRGVDLRLRQLDGVPEYDLLLQPGADLSHVSVHVEGAQGMSIAGDGSLIIDTALGPLAQSLPKTWQTDTDGTRHDVICNFILLGSNRFGFAAPGWDSETSLTIDPGLIWSTFLGGRGTDQSWGLSVDASGVVTVAGRTGSSDFPPTTGAYDPTFNGGGDNAFVTCVDPSKSGTGQLLYSTFLGGRRSDVAFGLSINSNGVVGVTGWTTSTDFPTTGGAYDRTHNSGASVSPDVFVSLLDPSRTGTAQLVFSSFLGGAASDWATAIAVDASGVVAVAGTTQSANFPTTNAAYDTTYNGNGDAFLSRLDPSKTGAAQLIFSSFLGGTNQDWAEALSVDISGVVTVAGETASGNFPTTRDAFDTTYNGLGDAFVSQLLPLNIGRAGLRYSTFFGGGATDRTLALSVDASGVVTIAGWTLGWTFSPNIPTTSGAYNTTYNGDAEAFVSRLDPKSASAGLLYSTFLGGSGHDYADAVYSDNRGVVTVTGWTRSKDFPTTRGAYDTSYNGGFSGAYDAFVSRLDTRRISTAQLVYSTYLATTVRFAGPHLTSQAVSVDAGGVVTLTGTTDAANFPTTRGAYDSTYNGNGDVFVSRLSMGVAFYADRYELSSRQAGIQQLSLDAGPVQANRSYAIFGSITGTSPGITLTGIHIPLNLDPYTDLTIGSAGPPIFVGFRGTLDNKGEATASFNPPSLPTLPSFTLHHAYVVFDISGKIHMASNAVPLIMK